MLRVSFVAHRNNTTDPLPQLLMVAVTTCVIIMALKTLPIIMRRTIQVTLVSVAAIWVVAVVMVVAVEVEEVAAATVEYEISIKGLTE